MEKARAACFPLWCVLPSVVRCDAGLSANVCAVLT